VIYRVMGHAFSLSHKTCTHVMYALFIYVTVVLCGECYWYVCFLVYSGVMYVLFFTLAIHAGGLTGHKTRLNRPLFSGIMSCAKSWIGNCKSDSPFLCFGVRLCVIMCLLFSCGWLFPSVLVCFTDCSLFIVLWLCEQRYTTVAYIYLCLSTLN
jgi:hypothetical protein